MIVFMWNLVLALIWAAGTGQMTLLNLLFGFALGHLALWLARDLVGASVYFRKWNQLVLFLAFVLRELLYANLRVAYDVVTPGPRMRPGIVAIPLDAKTDAEITLLANLISLTPGTLSLDISTDRQALYIHAMFIRDRERLERTIKQTFERRLLELFR